MRRSGAGGRWRARRSLADPGAEIRPQDVELIYGLLLGRSPESEQIVTAWQASGETLQTLATRVLESSEFAKRRGNIFRSTAALPAPAPEALALLEKYAHPAASDPDCVTNFLGVRTRIRFLAGLANAGGLVEGLPIPCNFHGDTDEWVGTLRSVDEARGRFVAVELGAGWGPWIVSTAVAAKRRGIRDVRVVGVEADPGKLAFLETHLRDNGLDPAEHLLLEAVAAAEDGRARFPVVADPALDWGAAALSEGTEGTGGKHGEGAREARDYRGKPVEQFVELAAVSLATLLAPYDRVDLVHCDIQGDETQVLQAGFPGLDQRVRRIVIGTHGRGIEEELFSLFAGGGWQLEAEKPCQRSQIGRRMALSQDGVQVWSNPRLSPS